MWTTDREINVSAKVAKPYTIKEQIVFHSLRRRVVVMIVRVAAG